MATAIVVLSMLANSDCSYPERILYALLLCVPSMLLAQQGHFGRGKWAFPSIVGQIYLVWSAGLLPSLSAALPPTSGVYFFESSSKVFGAVGYLVWFAAFATAAGRAPDTHPSLELGESDGNAGDHFGWTALLILFLVWIGGCIGAAQESSLSSWTAAPVMEEVGGSSKGALILLYSAFVGLIPILAFWALLRARRSWRWVFYGMLAVGLLFLVLYSNRRLIIFTLILVVFLLKQAGRKLNKRLVVALGLGAALMLGPLLWPIRLALQNPDLLRAQGDLFQIAGESVYRYVTDPEFRALAGTAGKENLQSGRFNYSDTYLATVQWVREHGTYRSPTFLFAPITWVPSFVWPSKNDAAASLNIKKQFNQLGISNEPDFPLSPIQESFFQFGLWGVLIGGMFWGWFGRQLARSFPSAWHVPEGMIVWASLYLGAMSFEGYFSMFLAQSREALFAGGAIWAVRTFFLSPGKME